MRFTWIASAALTLGVTSFLPTLAQADERHDDRGHQQQRIEVRNDRGGHEIGRFQDRRIEPVRVEHDDRHIDRDVRIERDTHIDIRYEPTPIVREVCPPDFDVTVSQGEVPEAVLCAARDQGGGHRIESVQYVRRDGKLFYRVRIEGFRDHDTNLRFTPGGTLLSVEAA